MKDAGTPMTTEYCRYSAYADPCCDGEPCSLCAFRKRYVWVFIKTENVNDWARDPGFSSDTLIRSSYA